MPKKFATAYPTKRFFLEMFTRDISLEDCILDLIDNSIDALIRTRDIDITENLLKLDTATGNHNGNLPTIEIHLSDRVFKIVDTCGGIPRSVAETEMFNFGHTSDETLGQLGAYGIGLKRALFKIGNHFEIESKTQKDGFKANIGDIAKWSEKDEKLEDWKIPINYIAGVHSLKQAGTSITIHALRPEVKMRINDGAFETSLQNKIAQTYSLFLERFVRVNLNKITLEPEPIPLGASEEVEPGIDRFEETYGEDTVNVFITASLGARSPKGEWNFDRAGWYVLCNGRVVVAANKTELTGWGVGLPQWHNKTRGFAGITYFYSHNPLLLPWTTTKQGLNRESPIYQKAKNKMIGLARPVISFLNDMYKSEPPEERFERGIAERIKSVDIRSLAERPSTRFDVPKKPAKKTTVSIQFNAKIDDVERVKKCVRHPDWSASKIGEYTFEHFLKKECPE